MTVAGGVLLLTCKKNELKKDKEMRGEDAVMDVRGRSERGMEG